MQTKKYLKQSIILTTIVIVVLLLLSLLPEYKNSWFRIKKINLVSDILKSELEKKKASTDSTLLRMPLVRNDSCKAGITCIEDYSDHGNALRQFIEALKYSKRKAIKIAFFGDSFIEGDVLSGSFRDTLQLIFGGKGVGYVPISSNVSLFRKSILHTYSNWKTHSIVTKKNSYCLPGTAGYCFQALAGNEVTYKPNKSKKIFKKIKLYYTNPKQAQLNYTINDSLNFSKELNVSDSLEQYIIDQKNIQSLKLNFTTTDSLTVFGISEEDSVGLYVDNFSMRGNSGLGLLAIPEKANKQFNYYQNYKLIILQYGLNVVSEEDETGYAWYYTKMITVVTKLKKDFPTAGILLLSVSDRSSNQNGKMATIPSITTMRDVQRAVAKKCKIAFWDLFTAMGGNNSIIKLTEANPPLAAKDYTHLTFKGGNKLAKKLTEAILFERQRYAPKK